MHENVFKVTRPPFLERLYLIGLVGRAGEHISLLSEVFACQRSLLMFWLIGHQFSFAKNSPFSARGEKTRFNLLTKTLKLFDKTEITSFLKMDL